MRQALTGAAPLCRGWAFPWMLWWPGPPCCPPSGAVFGTAAMLEGMTARIEEELGFPVKAVATGGFGREVAEHCRRPLQYDGDLLLEGLRLIYEKNRR